MKGFAFVLVFIAGCCVHPTPGGDMSATHDLSQVSDLSSAGQCVPQFQRCSFPDNCCPGLTCVGGACALVGPMDASVMCTSCRQDDPKACSGIPSACSCFPGPACCCNKGAR
jgi:hypothetical protein